MPVASTYETIATQTLPSNEPIVDFTSIPATYTDLVLVTTTKWTGSGNSSFGLSFNTDYNNNYGVVRFYAISGTITVSGENNYPATQTGQITDANWTSNIYQINGYANTNFKKLVIARDDIASNPAVGLFMGRWNNTAAINAIRLWNFDVGSTRFAQGSVFTLYGIKAA